MKVLERDPLYVYYFHGVKINILCLFRIVVIMQNFKEMPQVNTTAPRITNLQILRER